MPPPQSLRIPKGYIESFRQLQEMAPGEFAELIAALTDAPPALRSVTLVAEVAPHVATSEDDLAGILSALASLTGLRRVERSSIDDVSLRIATSADLEVAEAETESFAQRIAEALSTRPVRILGKAVELSSEHDKVFMGARLFTDVRPIFGDTVTEPPEAALISHTLKIEFVHNEGMPDNVYIALDSEDLIQLQEILQRAVDKADTTEIVLRNAGLPYLRLGDEQ